MEATTLKVTVKNCGTAAGTLGWFKSIIDDSEIVIRPTRTGEPALWLHENHRKDGTPRTEKEGNTWICGARARMLTIDDEGYQMKGDYKAINVYDNEYEAGFTSYALTPACYKAIDEFIDQCVETFAAWFEAQ